MNYIQFFKVFTEIFKSLEFNFDSSSLSQHLTLKQINELINLLEIKKFKKGTVLTEQGDLEDRFFLIKKGIVSATAIDAKGKKFTRSLFTNNQVFLSPMILRDLPSKITHTILIDSTIIIGSYKSFIELTKKHHNVALLYNKILQEAFISFDDKVYLFGSLNATEKYLELLKSEPKIETLISQKQIAYAIGVSPVQLSRLKSKLL